MSSNLRAHPWHSLYSPGVEADLHAPETTVLAAFIESVDRDPDAASLNYFGRTLTRAELAGLSGRIARVLGQDGVGPGDRVAISLQNTPLFPASMLAVWSLGAVVVPVNPMLRPGELKPMLADSGACAMIAHPEMSDVVDAVRKDLDQRLSCWWSDPGELAGDMPLPFPSHVDLSDEERFILAAAERTQGDWQVQPVGPDDPALITYTSGTTGPSKGAISSHRNLMFQALNFRQWLGLEQDSSVLTVAPLFHITGVGAHLSLGLAGGYPLVMTYRFEPVTMLGLIDAYRPTFTIGAITAFISMLDCSADSGKTLQLLPIVYSGGAPVPATVVERFKEATGRYIHNMYGLTETSSACIGVPFGTVAPIDEASGALSVGIPMGGTTVTIVDDEGHEVPPGVQGEIVVSGPQEAVGYWNKPAESANTFRPDGVYTGDIGVMDEQGWVFVVDRKKDLVVVSGYKVWPRDVEEVLYQHAAVKEVAVVGKPDEYRGETLHAFYSVRSGATTSASDLKAWCRDRLSAYKVPTEFIEVDEVPKTPTGKILRRSFRD
jgi:long-chain acyl-CoA synthetase